MHRAEAHLLREALLPVLRRRSLQLLFTTHDTAVIVRTLGARVLPLPALHLLHLTHAPAPHDPQTQRRERVARRGEDLGADVAPPRGVVAPDLQRDRLADEQRHADAQPRQAQARGQVREAEDLGADGGDGAPEGAGEGAADDGEEGEQAHGGGGDFGGDPEGEAEDGFE